MANDERKLARSSLIPLEIDPASILSLSKGVIFDTIVHNLEYTLNNRRTEPLPWKLIGMSLICDPSRNKKYLHKLQKMQCVPSVICTQIYHSKLIKTESGVLTTPGKKIVLATSPSKRLTGIIVCRSIDELLLMETSNTENAHFIQYKLLSYERIATRELVNGPKLSSVGDKIIKTVFDFELTQNNGFPRQLLPVAVISFSRHEGYDLCASIRHFLTLKEHKTFDKSYLVTTINVEVDCLREERERKEEEEIERILANQKAQRRQPLADLSKQSTDTENASSEPVLPRVPPLKIKLPRTDKPVKPTVYRPSIDPKFRCFLTLDRVDLAIYNISNLPASPPIQPKKSNGFSTLLNSVNNGTKSLPITKPHEHHKPLKRLNNSEPKKPSSLSSEISKKKPSNDSKSIPSSNGHLTIKIPKDVVRQHRSLSSSSLSPIYRPKPSDQKPAAKKQKVQREALPSNYHCSISLTRIDLSMYNIDLPPMITAVDPIAMDVQTTETSSPTSSAASESTNASDKNSDTEIKQVNILSMEPNVNNDIRPNFPNVIDRFSTPDLNESELDTNTEVLPSATTDEPILSIINEVRSIPLNEIVSEMLNEMVTQTTNEVLLPTNDKVPSEITNEETSKATPSSSPPPAQCRSYSPVLPPLDDDPVLFSIGSPHILTNEIPDLGPQEYIVIVPCSDDDDDFDDNLINEKQSNTIKKDPDTKTIELLSSPLKTKTCPTLMHPSLSRVLGDSISFTSHRLSTSSSSSCSSISTSILHNQSPSTPLQLTEILMPQQILKKKQRKLPQPITFHRYDFCIPTITQEPLIDPRLIYRLQSITTDLRWDNSCTQCSTSPCHSPTFTSPAQTILYDRKCPSDFVDPRRDSLKLAILHIIYQRIKLLIPNIFVLNSNQFQKFLFEQTNFKTNCSLHLEYLLHKLKESDDMNFFHMIKTNDEFQLSPFVAQLILK